ncbi:MAG: HAD-IIIA family hydrolase, partial [Acidobacteriota bacterium]
ARIDAIYFCPHHPEATDLRYRRVCDCRKPKPGMLLRAAADMNLELSQSVVIGDRYLDIETAHSVGALGVLVRTGYGGREYDEHHSTWPRMPDLVSENVAEAVQFLVGSVK